MTQRDADAFYNRRATIRLYALVTVYAPRVWANRLAREAWERSHHAGE